MEAVARQDTTEIRTNRQRESSAVLRGGGGSVRTHWDEGARMTRLGGVAYFAEYLRDSGFLDAILRRSPLRYTSHNAPRPADVMGTLLLAVLDGISRYAGINTLRQDTVCPELLGFGRLVSEDSVRNGLRQVSERPEEWDAWIRSLMDRLALPLLSEPYVADMDNTVKPLYGHQEGAQKSYNPKKPGRPSQNHQTWAMGTTRLILGVDVLPGKRHAGKYGAALAFDWIRRLPPHLRPRLLRGDVGYGSSGILDEADSLALPYLFKLSRTQKMKRHFRSLCRRDGWTEAGDGWQGLFQRERLSGWSRERRCLFLRRPVGSDPEPGARPDQLLLPTFDEWAGPPQPDRRWDFCVLVTSDESSDAIALSQLYRDRGDCENIFDELKNQWGWGGFVTQDLARTRLVARFTALLYGLWSVFMRLASPDVHREAKTSRPMLLNVLGRAARSGRETVLHLVSTHSMAPLIARALDSIHNYLRALRATAEQLGPGGMWEAILRAAFRHFLGGKPARPPPLVGNQWMLPLLPAPS